MRSLTSSERAQPNSAAQAPAGPRPPVPTLAQRAADGHCPQLRRMRCACRRCGAHTITNVGSVVAGNCCLCGSYELTPLEVVTPRAADTPL